MAVLPLTGQASLHRMQSIDCNGVELTVIGLWTCGKLLFGVMNLALHDETRLHGGCPANFSLVTSFPTENSLAVLNHKILEANSQVQKVKLGGHQTCLSINRLWHGLCDMLHCLVLLEPQLLDIMVIMALYRSPLNVTLWPSSFFKKYGPMIPPAHKAHKTVSIS
ncbi:hypothetical protein TNCV_949191 [Trichonephila clavipes]|nr:hypothetical protein TNCV_949191 [Trichonephila clavipes]